ncbi:MAG TPA: hypothetical protein VF516_28205 [Kofleriaceae bacterium]
MRAVAAVWVLLTGCFYIDPILSRPRSLIIRPDVITRGGVVTLAAQLVDAESQAGSFDWTVSTCSGFDQGVASGCDSAPFYPPPGPRPDDSHSTVSFTVPPMTRSGARTQAIQVTLDARNDRGALAQSDEQYAVGDAPPAFQLDRQSHSLAVGAPIDVIATYSDVDSALDGVVLAWTATAPGSGGSFPLEEIAIAQDPGDPGHRKAGKRLTPTVTGNWDVQVTARDPEGGSTTHDLPFTVVADQPPCLQQWLPTVPPAGATLPISTPTVFQVPLVDDDLDPYPPIEAAPQLTFAWSILRPRTTQREVQTGATGNAIVLDPAVFTPGDVVELRVEIYDRQHTALPCDDAAATCSITSSDRCLQRQTWRVEVR